jgi:hypothetical protein
MAQRRFVNSSVRSLSKLLVLVFHLGFTFWIPEYVITILLKFIGYILSHPVLKVNRMRTMYVPGSVIHVHSDYINDSS